MKNKFGLFGVIAVIAAIGFSITGCEQSTSGTTTVDRSVLGNDIVAAQALLAGTVESVDGTNVATTDHWASPAVRATFTNAIATAQDVYNNNDSTQATVNTAVSNLAAARATFMTARQPGSYMPGTVDRTALGNAIINANNLLLTTVESEDGTGITHGYWAPHAAITVFTTAIDEAQGTYYDFAATQSTINAAAETLAAAQTAFMTARQPGTYGSATVDRTALGNAIIDANNLLLATVESEDGVGITYGYWAPYAAITVFITAINEAQNAYYDFAATQPTINTAVSNLAAARTTFMTARRSGDSEMQTGDGNFTINFRPDISTNITGPTVNLGSTGEAPAITLLNPSQFDTGSIRWLLGDGTPVPAAAISDGGATLALNSLVHNDRTGTHRVTVEVRIGGVLHSRIIIFTVEL